MVMVSTMIKSQSCLFDLIGSKISDATDSWRIWRLPDVRRSAGRTLMICSWTPSSVCGPWKQLQMVSTSRSISLLPGVLLSGALPVMWPYAISFYRRETVHRLEQQKQASPFAFDSAFVLRCMSESSGFI